MTLIYTDTGHYFELGEDYYYEVPFNAKCCKESYVRIFNIDGRSFLHIKKGFLWNASGPTIDTPATRRGSLLHDGLYSLLHKKTFTRKQADKVLYNVMREDGVNWFRARYWYHSVRFFYPLHLLYS